MVGIVTGQSNSGSYWEPSPLLHAVSHDTNTTRGLVKMEGGWQGTAGWGAWGWRVTWVVRSVRSVDPHLNTDEVAWARGLEEHGAARHL